MSTQPITADEISRAGKAMWRALREELGEERAQVFLAALQEDIARYNSTLQTVQLALGDIFTSAPKR